MTASPEAVAAIGADGGAPLINRLGNAELAQATQPPQIDFQKLLSGGLETVDSKLSHADDLVRQFAVDDSIPVHQVTLALEEARLSVELAMQVRARMVETYREFMNMQL